ncbi:hypothetical protein FPL14_20350 [Cohnella cholangitidis]|uniref:Cardiolipin synthase N-terminal domain-containing protein n=1 Tax=Cohnella cholangitidis TaxID=2598458 RepID=A0A7G5C235_9BACL|nr:hypothetical protein FPL14_20350 [Cohnella cholangitidis]
MPDFIPLWFVLLIVLAIVLIAVHLTTCVWAYGDCISNGKSTGYALVVSLNILLIPILGLVVYLFVRNIKQ